MPSSCQMGIVSEQCRVTCSVNKTTASLRFPGPQGNRSISWWIRKSGGSGISSRCGAGGGIGSALGFGGGAFIGSGGSGHATQLWPLGSISSSAAKPKARNGVKKVLILMSDTGGGHRASAQALKAGFQQTYGKKFDVEIVDIWTKHTGWPINQIPKSYSFLVKNAWMWRLGFHLTNPRIVHVPIQTVNTCLSARHLSAAFDHYNPDLVVSVHPLMQHTPLAVLKQRSINEGKELPPFATVVTDLARCHNTWFHKSVDRCFVPTNQTKKQALGLGLTEQQIVLHGLPIRPVFSQKLPTKKKLRKMLGMKDKSTALLVGGGEGMGKLELTLQALSTAGVDCQVVVICGRNQKLVNKLKATEWPPNMNVVVNGFVDNMHQWMGASDCIITKAGPGTIAESLICGLPMLLNGFVPGQEADNVDFVTENQVGTFEKDPKKIADILKEWLEDAAGTLATMSERARAMGRPDALFRIVEDLATLTKRHAWAAEAVAA
eukprot:CAMPEP_0117697956 /NCGR_PEP_ID=MMETSP0804-20121206/29512_1 /TAXON_ID=1074897 /ORGANISM="Tetraselmis astigmatica, Strain CCMP880" /LENGTH=490 /DNA_ID=CAMNT_0005512255 /DNA_START=222 /DNA_END=1694 /DNA_ORIENTATION=+